MSTITYDFTKNNISITDLNILFENTGWNARQSATWETMINKAGFVCRAFDNNKLVGFARVFDDGVYYVIVCDVITHKDYRGQGIATKMVQEIIKWAKEKNFKTLRLFADIHSDPGLFDFYEKLGFEKMDNAMRLKGLVF